MYNININIYYFQYKLKTIFYNLFSYLAIIFLIVLPSNIENIALSFIFKSSTSCEQSKKEYKV